MSYLGVGFLAYVAVGFLYTLEILPKRVMSLSIMLKGFPVIGMVMMTLVAFSGMVLFWLPLMIADISVRVYRNKSRGR